MSWICTGLIKLVVLLIVAVSARGRWKRPVHISKLSNCKRTWYRRAVDDSTSPWVNRCYTCRNMDPSSFWTAECRKGHCVDPTTLEPILKYKIKPVTQLKKFRGRGKRMQEFLSVTIACKCVPV